MKLISMTDFVLQDKAKLEGYSTDEYGVFNYNHVIRLETYANLLKQPLKLSMFVPVDEKGNVMYEPKAENYFDVNVPVNELSEEDGEGLNEHYIELCRYEDAKENVLFEGFTISGGDAIEIFVYNGRTRFDYSIGSKKFYHQSVWIDTVEKLVEYNITLTKPKEIEL